MLLTTTELMFNNKKLFLQDLSKIIGAIAAKESLLAAMGFKTSRIGVSSNIYPYVIKLFKRYKIQYVIGNYRYTYINDIGKGGWSNRFGDETHIERSNAKGDYFLYIANSKVKAKAAREKEENEEEFEFGETLGIPSCCAKFYVDYSEKAFKKQNDFVLFVLEKTISKPPYDFWNNYVSQYFGYSLLSFFPCSFDCPESVKISKQVFNLLDNVYPDFAKKFLYFHKQNILYTEYRGIYLFENSSLRKDSIVYKNSRIHSTIKNSSIGKTIFQCDNIMVKGKNHCTFYIGDKLVRNLIGENIALCLFN